ncbi:MAG: YceK/YidQ family lipoprotein [Pseudomonadota bacterium]
MMPRVYSGVSYDICILRGKPSHTSLWLGSAPQLMFVDLALSAVLDTIALLYTIYEQINEGHIHLK